MMPYYAGYQWWMLIVGGLMMLLFWVVVIALAYFAIRAVIRPGSFRSEANPPVNRNQTPLDILNERYARGEITREEYINMKSDLGGQG